MDIRKCENGHYYDSLQYAACPYCAGKLSVAADNGKKTLAQSLGLSDLVTEAYGTNVAQTDKTIGIFKLSKNINPIAGWLVCIEGPAKGRSFSVLSGKNFAGRNLDMDIRIADDPDIAAQNHFTVVYDSRNISFYIVPGDGSLTYLNGACIETGIPLKEDDRIKAGNSEFIFINYCKEGRCWL